MLSPQEGTLRWGPVINKVLGGLHRLPGGASDKERSCPCRRLKRCGFNPWIRNIPWRGVWQPTLVFLPGESHGQKSLAGYSLQGCKELDTIEATEHERAQGVHNAL